MIYLAAVVIWVVFTIFAFNNHFLRSEMYGPRLGETLAHYVGVALQILFILGVTFLLLTWLRGDYTVGQLWAVGVIWVVLTAGGELWLFGRAAPGWRRDWIQQYNLLRGRVWVLVLLALLFAPILVHNWFIA